MSHTLLDNWFGSSEIQTETLHCQNQAVVINAVFLLNVRGVEQNFWNNSLMGVHPVFIKVIFWRDLGFSLLAPSTQLPAQNWCVVTLAPTLLLHYIIVTLGTQLDLYYIRCTGVNLPAIRLQHPTIQQQHLYLCICVFVCLCITQAAVGSTSTPIKAQSDADFILPLVGSSLSNPTPTHSNSNHTLPSYNTIPYHTSYHTMPYDLCPTQNLLRLIPNHTCSFQHTPTCSFQLNTFSYFTKSYIQNHLSYVSYLTPQYTIPQYHITSYLSNSVHHTSIISFATSMLRFTTAINSP